MYDRSKRSGLLYEKVRYKQRKRQDKKKILQSSTPNPISETDERAVEELIVFFDSCVLTEDKPTLLQKMKASVQVRKASNESNREIFDKCFHLYRVDIGLVRCFCRI